MIQALPTRAWIAAGLALATALMGFAIADAGAQGETVEIHASKSAEFWGYGQPIFIAIVGTDDRPGVSGARADAVHLVGINPASHRATILNIPRDTYTDIPGHGRRKITDSHSLGRAELVGQTLKQLVGAEVPFVITTNFEGFTGIVNDVGGVDITVPYGITDSASGANVTAGFTTMGGEGALAYARARKGTPRGDFSRTSNQGLLMLAALEQLQAKQTSPADLTKHVATLLRHIKTSSGVAAADLYQLARLAMTIPKENVMNITMPGTTGSAGGASVVFPGSEAPALFADFADDAIVEFPPAQDGAGNTFP